MSNCHENCVGKQACVQLIRNAEAKATEKAKADKLALAKKYERLNILAVKYCPSSHADWDEVKRLTLELGREILEIEAE